MRRRDLLKFLAAGVALPVLPPDILALMRAAQTEPGYKIRTLSSPQNDLVVAMIDLIIPATETPGAKGARVNECIDVILSEWATPEEREHFLSGLAGVDHESNTLFGKNFVDCTVAQQTSLLQSLDQSAMAEAAQERDLGHLEPEEPIRRRDRDTQLKGTFFKVFKRITLHGYYTSEIGFAQELKLRIIPGSQHGCADISADQKA
jgi:glucoside 3-dehydrogenase (cytochrome c) hitch-hiker subunit